MINQEGDDEHLVALQEITAIGEDEDEHTQRDVNGMQVKASNEEIDEHFTSSSSFNKGMKNDHLYDVSYNVSQIGTFYLQYQ